MNEDTDLTKYGTHLREALEQIHRAAGAHYRIPDTTTITPADEQAVDRLASLPGTEFADWMHQLMQILNLPETPR